MKKATILGLLVALAIVGHGLAERPEAKSSTEGTKVTGLLFYADWCGSCKVLDPKLDAVTPEFSHQPILFTRVDLTNDETTAHATRYANYLGLGNIYAEYEGRTGFMLLVDAKSKDILGRLTRNESKDDIRTMLTEVLAKASEVADTQAAY